MRVNMRCREEKKFKWKPATFSESIDPIDNPGIGWYQIYAFSVLDEFCEEEEKWALPDNQHLALVRITLGGVKDRSLNSDELLRIRQILSFFIRQKKDIILRFVYDGEGRGLMNEPALFSQVRTHMQQLGEILREYRENIYIYQGILIGSWGEMHTSKFLQPEKIRILEEILEDALGEFTFRAVRKPVDVRNLCDKKTWQHSGGGTLTCFDDAIFGSQSHMGTFGDRDTDLWKCAWGREEELNFLHELGKGAPIGGEVVFPGEEETGELESFVEELTRLQISYLNCCHDMRLLDEWRTLSWEKKGIFRGMNGYDYIGRHLGYRFCVRNCTVLRKRGVCFLCVEIENTGFSCIYEETEVFLMCRQEDTGKKPGDVEGRESGYGMQWKKKQLPWNPKDWISGQLIRECARWEGYPPGAYFLGMNRKRDREKVRFANEGECPDLVFLGKWG